MTYIYILQSDKDRKLYIGQTNNLEDRIARHNGGRVKATRYRRPLKLLVFKHCESRRVAMREEKYLKSLKGGNELKRIIQHWGVAKW